MSDRKIEHAIVLSNNQAMITMNDGSRYYVNVGGKAADLLFQPDDKHYPKAVCYSTTPTEGFDPIPD